MINGSTNNLNGKMTARTHKQQKLFLDCFKTCGVASRSAKAAGVARRTHYKWIEEDPDYVVLFAEACDIADDALMYEIRRRALDLEKRDTVALIVALKIRGIFVERREVSGPDGGPQKMMVMTDEDKVIAERIANRRLSVN